MNRQTRGGAARRQTPRALSERLREAVMAGLFAALTCVLSLVAVPLPFSPVPVTGQTLGVMLAGAVLGPMWGAISVLVYLAIGALGFPAFAGGGSGPGTLVGPTGGYLFGFAAGACVTGFLARSSWSAAARRGSRGDAGSGLSSGLFWRYLASTLAGGILVIHTCGTLWLARFTGRTAVDAFLIGSAPFLPGDVLKAVAASLVAGRLRWTLTGLQSSRKR